tara:strand:+ start:107544 stop:107678 length:135 start_codon:yes stop_codon:yes gene_type:complete
MLALAGRERPADREAMATDRARSDSREEIAIDTLHYFVVFMLGP